MVTLGIFGGEWFRRRGGSIYSDERGSISAFFPHASKSSIHRPKCRKLDPCGFETWDLVQAALVVNMTNFYKDA